MIAELIYFFQYFQFILSELGGSRRKVSDVVFAQGQTLIVAQQCEILSPCTDKEIKATKFSIKETKSQGLMILVVISFKLHGV